MILNRIVEFAERHAAQPTGYQPRFITKVIRLRPNGTLINVQPLSGEKRGKREGRTRSEPQESPLRTVGVKARLLADNVNYALGKTREKDKPEQVQARHAAWITLLDECMAATSDPDVSAVVAWVQSGGPSTLRDSDDIEEDDDLTFEVDGRFPTDQPAIRQFWANRAETKSNGVCIITGRYGAVVDRMPAPIKGVPDGQMSGTALISVNNAAGESYGLSAALNSPVSPDAAEMLCNGLNILLNEEAGTDEKGRRKYKYSLRVGKSVFVAWCRDESEFSPFKLLEAPDPDHVQQIVEQARRGGTAPTAASADFYVLALSANAARIVVRDYHETTLDSVKANLGQWFQRLEIIGLDGRQARPVGIYRLAGSLYRDANKEMPAHVPTALVTAALAGRPIPEYILGLAVKRNLAMQGPYFEFNKNMLLSLERIALIKAILEQGGDKELSALNEHHQDPAYHCGRLLAVLESIQRYSALPAKLNSTLVDRYYGAACCSPGSILGTLVNNAQPHLAKMRKGKGDGWAQRLLQDVLSAVGDHFPKTLSLQRQGLFALGYYHQKAYRSPVDAESLAVAADIDSIEGDNQ